MKIAFLTLIFICSTVFLSAQDTACLRSHINILAADSLFGRGYVHNGSQIAADYLQNRFKSFGLKPFGVDGYQQPYHFDVNTFPNKVAASINGKKLVAGINFLVDDASKGGKYSGKPKVLSFATDSLSSILKHIAKDKSGKSIYLLSDIDKADENPHRLLYKMQQCLPAGCYIIPWKGKFNWSVSTGQGAATILLVQDTVLPKKITSVAVEINAKLEKNYECSNVLGYVPGMRYPDSFIVLSAHYDHLGMMGKDAIFNGASDNASGTALLLCMAAYFAQHPQKYSIAFMAFSGEEAGLLGSAYYIGHQVFPIGRIHFLINMDIMGNASDGITVVNATEVPEAFHLLTDINDSKGYLPEVRSRGISHNSDHYHFTERGVPGIFIYSNGGPGYYHDVFDTPSSISLKNIDKVTLLIRDFITELNNTTSEK